MPFVLNGKLQCMRVFKIKAMEIFSEEKVRLFVEDIAVPGWT